jgi:sialate O-acetylesterase
VVSRESMRKLSLDLHQTGMVVTIDTGDAIVLHPKNKKPIGLRHAYLALGKTYGLPIVHEGPVFSRHAVKDGKIVLHFESAGTGLVPARKGKLDAFAIAGKDRSWHWAEAKIEKDLIVLSSPKVQSPVAARYAWAMNPSQRNLLYNKEGFPASPFRTDNWPLYDPDVELIDVIKPTKPDGYKSRDWVRPSMTQ